MKQAKLINGTWYEDVETGALVTYLVKPGRLDSNEVLAACDRETDARLHAKGYRRQTPEEIMADCPW